MNTSNCRRIAAHFTLFRRSLLSRAIVSIDGDGRVVEVRQSDNIDSEAGVEFYNGILIPEFVNAHCHLELSYMKGLIEQGGGFTEFARSIGRVRGGASSEKRVRDASCADSLMWHSGVGAVGDICNGDSAFGIKSASRIDYLNLIELFGLNATSADTLLPLVRRAFGCGMRAAVTPHSTYSLNDDAFRAAVASGDATVPLSIHFMESEAERELYEGRGELHQWYAERGTPVDFASYRSPAYRIVECIPPERDIMLIHNCFVTEEDIDIIENHFSGRVTWVLCPRSNRYISGVVPPVELLRRKGVNIAVGTDSLASNTSLDILEELKMFKGVPLEELLGWATVNGAEALNLAGTAGEFEQGYRSGAVLIEGVNWSDMSLTERSTSRRIV